VPPATSSTSRSYLKTTLTALIVAGVLFFFARAVQRNWADVRAHDFQLNYLLVALSFVCAIASALLATLGWQLALNGLSERRSLTFTQSFATVNVSGLTKYLPGKLWSYALQMYWLNERGFSKSRVLFVNILNLAISLAAGIWVSLVMLLGSPERFERALILGLIGALSLSIGLALRFHGAGFKLLQQLLLRVLKREVSVLELPGALMVRLHAVHAASQLVSGLGACVLCYGIGYEPTLPQALLVVAALVLADAAGFLAVIVPAGVGVRESVMYLLLGGAASGSLAVVLPLVSRLISMATDVVLGLLALRLHRTKALPDVSA